MWEAGGMPMLMRTLLDGLLHGDCITVTGKTLAENLRGVTFNAAQEVMRPTTNSARRRLAGWLACPAISRARRVYREGGRAEASASPRPARVFDCEEEAFAAVQARNYKEGVSSSFAMKGRRGAGMREMLSTTAL